MMHNILLAITLAWTCILPWPISRNLSPVIEDDVVVVTAYTAYVEIPVCANDHDPKGQPLHVVDLGNTVNGKAVLLEDDTVGVFPEFPFLIGAFDLSPILIGSGDYVISDGNQATVGHWSVYYQPLPAVL